ncbi:cadherin EGF LAG seven-pass G-type receptor 1-like isoform X2 [Brienomyrus brachyistius]|uniref:cadherin EGF LAG seven-pass G-type receptor 1-like isoform X2 n=1 Tax=Brienomyrus brachyistius TaxID=42636 RepID=UPI0020B22C8D|nr:cadherin EGF LAG seven-pass G-type receptor 1-like isoform X2 [Brienomyrus brachyistius]
MELQITWIWGYFLLQVPMLAPLRSQALSPGAAWANTSVGPGWMYETGRTLTPKFVWSLLEMEGRLAVSALPRKLRCAPLHWNPAPLFSRIKKPENSILTRFLPIVHGQDCFIKYKRNSRAGKPVTYINYFSRIEANSFLTAGKLTLNVKDLLFVLFGNLQLYNLSCKATSLQVFLSNGSVTTEWEQDRSRQAVEGAEASLFCMLPTWQEDQSVRVKLRFMTDGAQSEGNHTDKRRRRNVNTAPQFQLPNYQVSVAENEPAGTRVFTLKAVDLDDGEAGRIEYSIEALFDSRSNDYFQIESQTGSITTKQPLDREIKDTHVFKVTASDHGIPQRLGTTYLTVTVKDTNDHEPVFEQTEYRVSIRENVEVGYEVLTIRATDGDAPSNANMIYKILNGDGVNSDFEIDSWKGLVKIKVRPDRETISQYQLMVEANDQGKDPGPHSATATVYITVEDENDNYPQFSKKRYVVQVPENIAVNTEVVRVEATDKDEGNNAKVTYSIISGNVRGQFYIHSPTGIIDVINPLDYETIREYNLRIKAQDGGRPPLINSTGIVVVRVVDVNDNSPMFVSTPFQATVLENVVVGYSVIHIQAIDADSGDNARLEYRLLDTTAGFPFAISNSTGWITVSVELDRESTEFYTFGVEALDHGIPVMSSSAIVSITVLDVNDNVPTFTEKLYSLKINEDVVVGTSVLTVTAVDRDINSVVTYQIASGNTRNRFAIASQSGGGLITLALPLDYKQERQYVLSVTASDGTRYDTAQVCINVTDANTHRPVFQSTNYQVLVSEDKPVGSTVVVISATDEDTGENARITYIMEDNVPQFKIDPDGGAITTQMEIDYEDQASYTLAIVAHDNGIPQKSDTTYVEIIIIDANDNAPQFLRDMYQGMVFEDAPVYTSVLQISASDRDSGSNGRLSYTFQGGDDGDGDFVIEQYSGIIRTARKLDRENVAVYSLKAYAVDKGIPPLKAVVDILVSVLDINDNAPVFEKDRLDIFVEENSPMGSIVARITATDPDEGTNAQILYQIVEGNVPEVFQLDIFTGDLMALVDLDYESKTEYMIVVQATSAPLVSRTTVYIKLVDVNDNDPVLRDFEIIFNNYVTNKSNSFPPGVIGKVPAHDPDVSDKLHYSFVEGNELSLLILDQETGDLKLSKALNNNRPLEAVMKMSVTDGLHRVMALCTLRVTIITDDMLTSSITVRLENMSQERFLSPLLGLFAEGVAVVLSTRRHDVFVFNIQNDTDTRGGVLNVTFSALRPGSGPNRYIPSEELQEQVYLNRTLLRLVSGQDVLPFDDNICLREPCENYMKCVSVLRFDSSAPFIASDTVLFRPIHPVNGVRCRCPAGFTGTYCETEIDLCYSGPCRNNGLCRSREGGYTCECLEDFTGEHCEVDARSGRCVPGVCKNGGRCVDLLVGGFMCQCAPGEYEKPYCEMTTRSFPGQSFVTFRGLRQRFHFTVSFMFATRERNGLLLYNGRFNEKHDFIALEIVEEQVQLTFSAGETKTTVTPFVPGGVSDGQWHSVRLHYYNKDSLHFPDSTGALRVSLYTAWLELKHKEPNVGRLGVPHGPSGEKVAVVAVDDCDIAMAVRFGSQLGNYSCAAQGTQTGPKKSLDLTGPLLLGGVPNLPEDFPVQNLDFVGCMRNLTIDSKPMDMASFIANNGTTAGCAAKRDFCSTSVCQNGGTCVNTWNTYYCNCPLSYGGKNCEQAMPSPRHFDGHALVSWFDPDITITVPWYMGLMFRTRQSHGMLMQANAGASSRVNLLVSAQHLLFEVFLGELRLASLELPGVRVDDGQWHHILVELKSTKDGKDIQYKAMVSLDYGMFQRAVEIGSELPGLRLKSLFVGGVLGENGTVRGGFQGCMQGVRMGETATNTANVNMQEGLAMGVGEGCLPADPCASHACPEHSHCSDLWDAASCVCDPGYFGTDCMDPCQLNPCEHVSSCVRRPGSAHGYACECGPSYYGQYCERKMDQPCPRGWWGHPVCGPCNCDVSKGFNPDCNKTTGECQCKDNHYRPESEDTCYPCDCFPVGAHTRTCDPRTGQCTCKAGVIGRQCNRCDNPFAEVTGTGCEVVYDGCPKAFDAGIWWPKTKFGRPAAIDCPKGSFGTAVRHCSDEKGWLPPNLFNCTTMAFSQLKILNEELHRNESLMDSEKSKSIARMLQNATEHVRRFYGNDVRTAYQLILRVLRYENQQQGFDLAATRDAQFSQNIIRASSTVLDPNNKEHWDQIQTSEGGTAHLLRNFEEYANNMAQNMRRTYLKPFTIVTENMIVAVDYLDTSNQDQAKMPRFQDIQNAYPKDLESSVRFPEFTSKFSQDEEHRGDPSLQTKSHTKKRRDAENVDPLPVAMVIIYRSLGQLLPEHYDPDRRSLRLPTRPVINTPIVSTAVHSEGGLLPSPLEKPVILEYTLLETEERTKPICVFWNHSMAIGGTGGWSSKGCELFFRNATHISCQCNHMTSFAVLMDISKREHGDVLPLKIVTYTAVSASLLALLLTFILLAAIRKVRSNLHNIHKNLVAALFLSELVFLIGINQTDNPFVCMMVAILLHYCCVCIYAWMFVEGLHVYRMLTELRNIDHGHMRFYYAIGWGVSAIVVGLAVGLDPQGYGNPDFCWLSLHDTLIWSLFGPSSLVVLVNGVIFTLALRATCGRRHRSLAKSGIISALRSAFLLLLLISATWLLGLMAVNSDIMVFHYLFAAFCCLEGIFVFLFYCVFSKDVRKSLRNIFAGKKALLDESSTTRASLLTRSLNCNTFAEESALYRTPIGESTVSMETSIRDESGQKPGISSGTARAGHINKDSVFPRNGTKGEDSDSDSELSADEHSISYASSHSSDSEGDEGKAKAKWNADTTQNNERQLKHGPHKVDVASNHVQPYWPVEMTTASDSESPGRPEKLRVEMRVNVELHPENKLNHLEEMPQDQEGPPPDNRRQSQQRKGILKNKITHPPPIADKNMKNRLREKLSEYSDPTVPSRASSAASSEGARPVSQGEGLLIKPLQRPSVTLREPANGLTVALQADTVNRGDDSDSYGSNETSI